MKSKDFEWLTDEFMLYCRSIQLPLFELWYLEQMDIAFTLIRLLKTYR